MKSWKLWRGRAVVTTEHPWTRARGPNGERVDAQHRAHVLIRDKTCEGMEGERPEWSAIAGIESASFGVEEAAGWPGARPFRLLLLSLQVPSSDSSSGLRFPRQGFGGRTGFERL
jgi:hypothetical protein